MASTPFEAHATALAGTESSVGALSLRSKMRSVPEPDASMNAMRLPSGDQANGASSPELRSCSPTVVVIEPSKSYTRSDAGPPGSPET
jgi:hypothetical protein